MLPHQSGRFRHSFGLVWRLIVGFVATSGKGQALGQTSTLVGVVRDSVARRPVVGAEVVLPGTTKASRTDSLGAYRIDGLSLRRYAILVRALGYAPFNDSISIVDADGNLVNVELERAPAALDTIVSSPKDKPHISPLLAAFEARRREGFGHFLAEEALRRLDDKRLSDVIQRLPGLTVARDRNGSIALSTRNTTFGKSSKSRPCAATVYLDGVLLYDANINGLLGSGQPPNLDDYRVNQLAGVEFYGGEAAAPVGFRHSGCGLLLIWTREK